MITIQSYVARSFIVTILPSCSNDFFLNQEIVDFSQYQLITFWFIRKKRWKKINECNLCLYYFIEIWLVGKNSWIYQQMAHLWPNQVTRIASNFQKDMRKEGNKMIFHLNTIFLKNNKQTNKWFHIHFHLFYLLNLIMPWLSRKPSKTDQLYFLCVINVWHFLLFFFFLFYSPFFGEDVHFEVPRDFRTLCFYLFDTDLIGKDTVLGKVS